MTTKESLINLIAMDLVSMEKVSIQDIKALLINRLYNYEITEISTTEVSNKNGEITKELFAYFSIGKLSSNKSEETIKQYWICVKQLCDFVHKEINMITSDDINFFLVKYKKLHNIKDHTMEIKRLYLSSVFSYLHKHNKISINPMSLVEPINYKKCVKTILSDEEIEKIRIACGTDKRSLAMVDFFLDTGVRITELCNVKLSDVDFVNKKCKVLGKGNKERYVYFSGKCSVRLADYLKERNDINFSLNGFESSECIPLFATKNKNHNHMHKAGVELIIKKLSEKSQVSRLHPHLFRATAASKWSEQGLDINVIARLLGHANLNTVQRYVLLSDERIANIMKNN